jgi:hypothetical protein
MTLSRRRLGLQSRLPDNNSGSSRQFLVTRTLLFGQRARRRLVVEVGRVPSLGPHHREERATAAMGRGEA